MSYLDFYDYLLINPSGWKTYEEANNEDEILTRDPDLKNHWRNRQLRLFMQRTSVAGFPIPPKSPILERILRFTGIVEERKKYAESEYEKK